MFLPAGHVEVKLAEYPHTLAPASLSELIPLGHYYMPSMFRYSGDFGSYYLKDGSSRGDLCCALPLLLP